MGNSGSSKKKQQAKAVPQQNGRQESEGNLLIDTKNILLLHKSNEEQLKVVRNFRDALIAKTGSTFEVTNFVNLADGNKVPKSLAWLDESNNIVLLCLATEAVQELHSIIVEKGFADQNGHLHSKVFTVSFGENFASQWPPKGLKKGSKDLRDFYFGFTDAKNLQPQDFMESLRLNSLIAAIKLTR